MDSMDSQVEYPNHISAPELGYLPNSVKKIITSYN